jgi:hypothetical protein
MMVAADRRAHLRVIVTATNVRGFSPATSAQVGPVVAPAPAWAKPLLVSVLAPSGHGARIPVLLAADGYAAVLVAPKSGRLTIAWYQTSQLGAKNATPVLLARVTASFGAHGTTNIMVRLTAKGRQLLRSHARLELTATGTLTIPGFATVTAAKHFRVRR